MDVDWDLAFADECGRYFARLHGMAPMTGRVVGWLLVCDPPAQTIAEIATALRCSRSAVTGSAAELETWSWVRRFRTAGERMDRLSLDPQVWERMIDNPAEYTSLGALAERGLAAMPDQQPDRRQRLAELQLFAGFVARRVPAMAADWRAELATARTSAGERRPARARNGQRRGQRKEA